METSILRKIKEVYFHSNQSTDKQLLSLEIKIFTSTLHLYREYLEEDDENDYLEDDIFGDDETQYDESVNAGK